MSFRVPLVAGNWKMNKNCSEAVMVAQQLVDSTSDLIKHVEVFIAPAFTALFAVSNILENSNISVAAQDVFWEEEGAFTGAISAKMLEDVGCKYVIIGHSERKNFFYETDETINKKIKTVLAYGMRPVLCFGEAESDREKGKTFLVIDKQVRTSLKGISSKYLPDIVLAYEPVWAIGSGNAASNDQAQEVHSFVRSFLKELYPSSLADSCRIIYGGSVSSKNIEGIMSMPDIDGVLVGSASLRPHIFSELVRLVKRPKLA